MTKADILLKKIFEELWKRASGLSKLGPSTRMAQLPIPSTSRGAFMEFDLAKGEFPITTLRPIAIKSAIKEMLWIYQDQSNSLELLNDKYQVRYWNDWEVGRHGNDWRALWCCR